MEAKSVRNVIQRIIVVLVENGEKISLFKKYFSTINAIALKKRVIRIYPRNLFSKNILNRIMIKAINTKPPMLYARKLANCIL